MPNSLLLSFCQFPGGIPAERYKRQDLLIEKVEPEIEVEELNRKFYIYPQDLQGSVEKYYGSLKTRSKADS